MCVCVCVCVCVRAELCFFVSGWFKKELWRAKFWDKFSSKSSHLPKHVHRLVSGGGNSGRLKQNSGRGCVTRSHLWIFCKILEFSNLSSWFGRVRLIWECYLAGFFFFRNLVFFSFCCFGKSNRKYLSHIKIRYHIDIFIYGMYPNLGHLTSKPSWRPTKSAAWIRFWEKDGNWDVVWGKVRKSWSLAHLGF